MSKLILMGLPIGNLNDLTPRVREALEKENCFYVEDTRSFRSLLNLLEIDSTGKIIDSFHDQSTENKLNALITKLTGGMDVCLVSEAGSPIISDPAFPVVRRAVEEGIEIETLPGISSVIVALELSGLPPQPFHFHGFLGRDGKVGFIGKAKGTHIFFESANRLLKTLKSLSVSYPEASVVVGRELTKLYQSVYRFKASEYEKTDFTLKGECVVLIHIQEQVKEDSELVHMVSGYLSGGASPKALAKIFSKITGLGSKEIYKQLNT